MRPGVAPFLAGMLSVWVGVSVSATSVQTLSSDPQRLLAEAVELHQFGDISGAIVAYEAFLLLYPDVADVRSNLGAALVASGDLGRAISEYRRALELGTSSDPTAIRFNLALAYYKTADFQASIEELTEVLRSQPAHKNAAILLADCHMRRADYPAVIEILTPFERDHRDDRALLYLLGTALIRDGRMDEGARLVDTILREGDSAEAHLLLGSAHLMVRDVPGAVEQFRKAVELNPELPSANAFLGKALRETGQVDEAIECFRRELELNPYDFESNLYTGVHLYRREQRYEQAMEHFERALRARPGALEARFQVGLIYILQNRTDEALEIVEEVVREAPDFLEGHVTLTRLYFRLRRTEDAQRHREIVEQLRAQADAETVKRVPADDEEPF